MKSFGNIAHNVPLVSIGWHHMTCGCRPDGDYGLQACPLHLAAPDLLLACQLAMKRVKTVKEKQFIQETILRATNAR